MTTTPDDAPVSPSPSLSTPAALLLGAAAAVVGLLPWLVTGMQLPLQNLWGTATMPDDMPLALLPFSQYMVLSLFGMLVLPGTLTGLVVRQWPGARPRRTTTLAVAGFSVVLAGAAVQTLIVIVPGLRPGTASAIYVAGITAVIVMSLGLAVAVCWLLVRGSGAAVVFAAVASSIATGYWFQAVSSAGYLGLPPLATTTIYWAGHFLPAILAGLALGWYGWNPPHRLILWAVALLMLWAGTAVLDTLLAVASTRAELGDPIAMLDSAQFRFVRLLGAGWLPPMIAGALGTLLSLGISQISRRAATQ